MIPISSPVRQKDRYNTKLLFFLKKYNDPLPKRVCLRSPSLRAEPLQTSLVCGPHQEELRSLNLVPRRRLGKSEILVVRLCVRFLPYLAFITCKR